MSAAAGAAAVATAVHVNKSRHSSYSLAIGAAAAAFKSALIICISLIGRTRIGPTTDTLFFPMIWLTKYAVAAAVTAVVSKTVLGEGRSCEFLEIGRVGILKLT